MQNPWTFEEPQLFKELDSSAEGLSPEEAARRLEVYGRNELRESAPLSRLRVFGRQLANPLLLLLVFAGGASAFTGEWIDSGIVLVIVIVTAGVGYFREYGAQSAATALKRRIRTQCEVVRKGRTIHIPVENVVPGDIILLSAGSLIPADSVVLEANDCFVSEAVLTGESFPVAKTPGVLPLHTPLGSRNNCVFLGTNVRSGTARCIVVQTGRTTEFGAIARRLMLRPPEAEFDRGIRRFSYLLTVAMLVMVLLVFVAHMFRGRPPVDTLLFSIALAVGLSPELLPAILSVNLARSAESMAGSGVLVRRLSAIENLGSMTVLCTDKTGTLTEGVVRLEGAYGPDGEVSPEVLRLAALNAACQTGIENPLDAAIVAAHAPDFATAEKQGEIPFDFVRKRLSVIVRMQEEVLLITKGAFRQVLAVCTEASGRPLDDAARGRLEERFALWGEQGVRVVAVATRSVEARPSYNRDDEGGLEFKGFLAFHDPPKDGAAAALQDLADLGVSVKLITGDNRFVTRHLAHLVGMRAEKLLTGEDLDRMHDEALWREAERTDLFVEVDPNQKERIILALKKTGHVVGFLGDGVNDAPAMHAADTSLSVEQAVDVAREAADFVLLDRHLDVIRTGIVQGRTTFANTMKYVLTTTSANLGNMLSMAVASLFLPFLPLLASQILLNNFLSDIPAVGLANDDVDAELIQRPGRWRIRFIGRFMVEFGLLSSVFDLLTFSALLYGFRATPVLFRTGWFVESLLTELVIALVVRTRRPFFRSKPGRLLLRSTLLLIDLTIAIPYLPAARLLGFVPLPGPLLATLIGITALYVLVTEMTKRALFRWADNAEGLASFTDHG